MADLFYGAPGFMAGLIRALRTQVEERRKGTHPLEMNGLLSTATLGLRAPPPDGVRHEELVRLSDGGTMRLVWQRCGRQTIRSEQGVVIICPGLNNSSHWPAVQLTQACFCRRGFDSVVLDCAPRPHTRCVPRAS